MLLRCNIVLILFIISVISSENSLNNQEWDKNVNSIHVGNIGPTVGDEIKILNRNPNDFVFNFSSMIRFPDPIYVDFGIIIDEKLVKILSRRTEDVNTLISQILVEMQKIGKWHGIHLNLIELEVAKIIMPNFITYNQLSSSVSNYLKTKSTQSMDLYFVLIDQFVFKPNDYFHMDHFCDHSSVFYEKYLLYYNLTAKYIAQDMMDAILFALINGNKQDSNCICPYNRKVLCMGFDEEFARGLLWPPKIFSDCYIKYFFADAYNNKCLFEKSTEVRMFSKCGDGVVDKGEDCDCSFKLLCEATGQDRCCDIEKCKFKNPTYQCTDGACCHNCNFKNNTVCRASYGECDIGEYCDGKSSYCPQDIVSEHYMMCNDNKGFCLNGMCTNFNSLCKYIYKTENVYYFESCYEVILTRIKETCQENGAHVEEDLCDIINTCQHFVCATNISIFFNGIKPISHDGFQCLLPMLSSRNGILSQGPNFLPCSKLSNHYCYNSKCTSDRTILNNCKENTCYDIDNSIRFEMKKKIPLYNFGTKFMLGIYEHTVKITLPQIKATKHIQTSTILIIFIIVGILLSFGVIHLRKNIRLKKIRYVKSNYKLLL